MADHEHAGLVHGRGDHAQPVAVPTRLRGGDRGGGLHQSPHGHLFPQHRRHAHSIFLGLDLLAIFVALKLSYRAARTAERVLVTAEEVRVRHESPRGGRTVWKSPTAFTRVALETLGDDNRVRLQLSGRRLTVGSALSPRERRDFGRALEAAVGRARAERWP
jgi:uncharacterized membrane protein